MPEYTKHEEGSFSWADLATTDVSAARDFYTGVFGWDVEETPIPGGGAYYMFKREGKDVCAAADQQPDERNMGIPAHWNSYFTVADVDQSAKVAEAAGGSIIAPPFDVMDVGRMSVIADPAGAVFCLWQPRTNIGAQVMNEPNTLGWTECASPDVEKVRGFYTEVLGATTEDMDMGEGKVYTLFKIGDDNVAGLMAVDPESMPPSWTVYFDVADCDATVDKAKSLGAQVFFGPESMDMAGRIAILADPQGAVFGVIQPAERN